MKKLITLCLGLVFLTACEKKDIVPISNVQIPVAPVAVFDPFAALPKETAIPDSNFEKVLIEKSLDVVLDGRVTTANICYLTELKIVKSAGIQSIKGIESFISLTKLQIEHQKITEIDLTKNTNLLLLGLWDNPLTYIDLSKNTKLTILGLSEVNMETVNLSKNVNLIEIAVQNGEGKGYGITKGFIELDLSSNINLQRVYVWQNRLKELDLTKNLKMTDVWYSDNPQLTTLKLTPTSNLKMVIGWNTGLEFLDLSGSYPQSVRVNDNPKLKSIKVTSLSWLEGHIKYWGDVWSKDSHTTYIE